MAETPEPSEATVDDRRRWYVREGLPNGEERTEEESRAMAQARLTEAVRSEGYVIDLDSLEVGPWYPVAVLLDGSVVKIEDDALGDGSARDWSVGAHERTTDDSGSTLLPSLLVYEVPDPFRAAGGEVRVRHNLGAADVDITVEQEGGGGMHGTPPAYSDLDGHQTSVFIAPGTVRIYVHPVEESDEGTPG